jgi:ATP sulfurylase
MKNCPHESNTGGDENGGYNRRAPLLRIGTLLRKLMSEGKPVPAEFSKPKAAVILSQCYDRVEDKAEVKLHKFAAEETKE